MRVFDCDLRDDIIAYLDKQGFAVQELVAYSWTSQPSLPDGSLLVSHPDWPCGMWLVLVCKTPLQRSSFDMMELAAQGRAFVIRNLEDALRAIERVGSGATATL